MLSCSSCLFPIDLELLPQMIRAIRHVLEENKWWHLPRYALGSSSGGCTALELALRFPLQACATRSYSAVHGARIVRNNGLLHDCRGWQAC